MTDAFLTPLELQSLKLLVSILSNGGPGVIHHGLADETGLKLGGANPLRVAPTLAPLPTTAPLFAQVKIVTTGTAVPLGAFALANGLVIKAHPSNAALSSANPGVVGPVGVSSVIDGTGTGYPLAPGEAISYAIANANVLYFNGTAGDRFFVTGN